MGNTKLAAKMDENGLEAHRNKTCFIVCGPRRFRGKVDYLDSFRYLGQMPHSGGLAMCPEATVQERVGRLKGATREIKGIIEEFEMQALGGMMAA